MRKIGIQGSENEGRLNFGKEKEISGIGGRPHNMMPPPIPPHTLHPTSTGTIVVCPVLSVVVSQVLERQSALLLVCAKNPAGMAVSVAVTAKVYGLMADCELAEDPRLEVEDAELPADSLELAVEALELPIPIAPKEGRVVNVPSTLIAPPVAKAGIWKVWLEMVIAEPPAVKVQFAVARLVGLPVNITLSMVYMEEGPLVKRAEFALLVDPGEALLVAVGIERRVRVPSM